MKLYGGRPGGNNKSKLSAKKKAVISVLLIILALITTSAAFAMNRIKAPELKTGQSGENLTGNNGSNITRESEINVGDTTRRENFFTVLVVGTDAASMSTDTIMLAAFDTELNTMNIMSIPRDTIINARRSNKKINCAYSFSGGDVSVLYDEVESVTGVRPDRYVLVSVDGFVELIDEIGGVTVDVPIDMYYEDPTQNLVINIKKGVQILDGYDAMGFMRYRKTYAEGDIGRIRMQHTFVDAIIKKILTPSTFMKIPELAAILSENVKTDLSVGNIIWIGKRLVMMDTEANVNMHMLPGYAQYYEGLSYYFPSESETLDLVNEFYNPYIQPIEALDIFTK